MGVGVGVGIIQSSERFDRDDEKNPVINGEVKGIHAQVCRSVRNSY